MFKQMVSLFLFPVQAQVSAQGQSLLLDHVRLSIRMKLESDGGTDDITPGPLAKSAEMKRLVGIAVANGTPIRVAYKDVRKRMRIEARRQKELDEGVQPKVVLDSFSQPGESRAATAVLTVEESIDSFR